MMLPAIALLFAPSLYEQAVERVLHERFRTVEYMVMNVQTKQMIARNWPDIAEPIPVGSLTKPFWAVTLPLDRYVSCEKDCWRPGGHGRLNLQEAIAFSCNQYFLQSDIPTLPRIPGASDGADATTLLGLRGDFRIAPMALAQGYVQIVRDVKVVREGMQLAVLRGTAHALKGDALAKTGTARCSHMRRGKGDGLVVVLWPSADPKWLLLVRVHGTTGAVAAGVAGQMVHLISDVH